ncbi:MAG: DMT family transporter [Rhodospirillales bacterium]
MSKLGSHPAEVPEGSALQGAAMVLAAGACWSLAGLFVRAMEGADAWQILVYRSAATLVFTLLLLAQRGGGSPWPAVRALGWKGPLAGSALACAMLSFVLALATTAVFDVVMMLCIAPLMAALLGRLLLGERVRRVTLLAMLIAVVGVAVMVWAGLELGSLVGLLLSLAAPFCFAVFTVTLRAAKVQDTLPAVAWAGAIGCLVSLIVVLAEGRSPVISLHDTLLALAMGSLQIGIGMWFFTAGAKRLSAAEATLLSLSEVVLAPIWVWLAFDEVPTRTTLVGGSILLGAMVLQAASGLRRRRPPLGLA